MNRPLRSSKKLPELLEQLRLSLNKESFDSVNLYFQDESRFGLMTHVGTALTAKGVKPIVNYQQAFKNTYLYGSFSPIDGSNFVWEIEGVDTMIFEAYLKAFSEYKPKEFKIVIIDNAGFHSTKNITIPNNIILVRIPSYTPELNPAEKVWQFLKERFKNRTFGNLKDLKLWLHKIVVDEITHINVMSIVKNDLYISCFKACFKL